MRPDHPIGPNLQGELIVINALADVDKRQGINIENMQSKSRKDYAYTILDVTGDFSSDSAKKMEESEDIIRVRVI